MAYLSDERLLEITAQILAKQHDGKDRHELERALYNWALPACGKTQASAYAGDMSQKARNQRVYR